MRYLITTIALALSVLLATGKSLDKELAHYDQLHSLPDRPNWDMVLLKQQKHLNENGCWVSSTGKRSILLRGRNVTNVGGDEWMQTVSDGLVGCVDGAQDGSYQCCFAIEALYEMERHPDNSSILYALPHLPRPRRAPVVEHLLTGTCRESAEPDQVEYGRLKEGECVLAGWDVIGPSELSCLRPEPNCRPWVPPTQDPVLDSIIRRNGFNRPKRCGLCGVFRPVSCAEASCPAS